MPLRIGSLVLLLIGSSADPSTGGNDLVGVVVDPSSVILDGLGSRFSLLVTGQTRAGLSIDLTDGATFRSSRPTVAQVGAGGVLWAVSDGEAVVDAVAGGRTLQVPVQVRNAMARSPSFANQIAPLFSRYGCNGSSCHGKAEGQNGFKLSVFGFDPQADYESLVKEGQGRRVFPSMADQSLLLLKPAGLVAHGGGQRLPKESEDWRVLRDWIVAGMPPSAPDDPKVEAIELAPRRQLVPFGSRHPLRVVASLEDGRRVDVTHHARFQSNNEEIAQVDEHGLVRIREVAGEVAVMASYLGQVDVSRLVVPRPEPLAGPANWPESNFIDELVHRKLRELHIQPSDRSDDADFLRRVFLDVIGTLPTADEARAFLADPNPKKRGELVDRLLRRPEYADYWSLFWSDLLRVDSEVLGRKGAYVYYRWIHDRLADNVPYDQFVRELLAAEGPLAEVGPANFYKAVAKPGEMASTVSQVFLGMRIACAECHHHPYDRWSQTDFVGMQAFFSQMSRKSGPRPRGGGPPPREFLMVSGDPVSKHPRTGETVHPHPLGTALPESGTAGDRRRVLGDWMTDPQNPWFASNLVNRLWAHFLGRGLIEPVDDARLTNPPSNPELLHRLAEHFVQSGYDLHQLIRTITASQAYQRSSRPNDTNRDDEQNYSRALFKRMGAEVLLDAVCQTTGVGEKFAGMGEGVRAIALWDSSVRHYFLKVFGRPARTTPCECERSTEPSVAQVLHIMNSPGIQSKLTHEGGRVALLIGQIDRDEALADELFLTFLSRFPREPERRSAVEYIRTSGTDRRRAAEDIAWSMLNSTEFVFNH